MNERKRVTPSTYQTAQFKASANEYMLISRKQSTPLIVILQPAGTKHNDKFKKATRPPLDMTRPFSTHFYIRFLSDDPLATALML